MWVGKRSYECDGKMSDYSLLTHLTTMQINTLPGKKINPLDLLARNFKPHTHMEKYGM